MSISLYSQSTVMLSNLRKKEINTSQISHTLDSLSIVPHSVKIYQNDLEISPSKYTIDLVRAKLTLDSSLKGQLLVIYRVMPFYLGKKHSSFKSSYIQNNSLYDPKRITQSLSLSGPNQSDLLDLGGLSYGGSFYRGITVGNNQDAALHSGFNMNISGKMNNGLEINASITDANIPLQPEGNSASLQQFDRIFINLKKDNHSITIGDFDIKQIAESKLNVFDRKLQGIDYKTSFDIDTNKKLSIGATAAVTRGVFARNTFTASENNQGPYRLFGNNGESFIIIIAGTERVYINGELMKRGFDNDYVINYNIGEVIFTPKRIITKDLRIVVEFQYTDRNYFRYSLAANAVYQSSKLKIYTQYFSEEDNKDQPLNLTLDTASIRILQSVGNRTSEAFVRSETKTVWNNARIAYRLIDTSINGTVYPKIYQWAEAQDSNVYSVNFTYFGNNKGNYIIKATGANGSVYQWIAPVNGVLQGSYEPVTILPTPKSHLQWNAGAEWKVTPYLKTSIEATLTQYDQNKYSSIDDNKNQGHALQFKSEYKKELDSNRSINGFISYEYLSTYFSPMTRYRNLEFNRDWDLYSVDTSLAVQNNTSIGVQYRNRFAEVRYTGSLYYKEGLYFGIQNQVESQFKYKRSTLKLSANIMNSSSRDSSTQFLRPKVSFVQEFDGQNPWSAEIGFYDEIKTKSSKNSELLSGSSFNWQNYYLNLGSSTKNPNQVQFKYIYRTEQNAYNTSFATPQVVSHTLNVMGALEKNKNQTIKWNLSYRNFVSSDTLKQKNEIKNNYLGRIEYNGQWWRGFLRMNSLYEVKAGREQKTQITFVKATNGYGNYAWKDLNNNGIFEINEAYVSPFNFENIYVKYYTVLPEYVAVNEVNWNQFFWIQPKALLYNAKGLGKIISKLSNQFRMDINRKIYADNALGAIDYLNPFYSFTNTNLIYSKIQFFDQLSFQKNESDWGLDLEWNYNDAKNIQSNGLDGYSSNVFSLKSRVNLNRIFTLYSRVSNGVRRNKSDFFAERNFSFVHNEIEKNLSCIFNQQLKLDLTGTYWFKSTSYQYAVNNQADLTLKWSRKNNGLVEAKFTTMFLTYQKSIPNTQVELMMLNGLQAGTNYIWSLNIGQKLTDYLQLNMFYNGRKNSASDQVVHSANMEVRAIF